VDEKVMIVRGRGTEEGQEKKDYGNSKPIHNKKKVGKVCYHTGLQIWKRFACNWGGEKKGRCKNYRERGPT